MLMCGTKPYLGTTSLFVEFVFAFRRVVTFLFRGCELVSHLCRHVLPRDGHVYVTSISTTTTSTRPATSCGDGQAGQMFVCGQTNSNLTSLSQHCLASTALCVHLVLYFVYTAIHLHSVEMIWKQNGRLYICISLASHRPYCHLHFSIMTSFGRLCATRDYICIIPIKLAK